MKHLESVKQKKLVKTAHTVQLSIIVVTITQDMRLPVKNTNCPFSLVIRLSKDSCPSLITVNWNHNHTVIGLQSLSYKDMSNDVVHHIKDLFNSGLLPGAAHREFLKHVGSICKDDIEYHLKLSHRSAVPRRNDFNNIYGEFNRKAYGTESLSEIFECLHQRVATLKHENQDYSLTVQEFDEKMNQHLLFLLLLHL